MSAPTAPVGSDRVRSGYLSRAERESVAAVLDAIAVCLTTGHSLPLPLRTRYAHACRTLHAPRGATR